METPEDSTKGLGRAALFGILFAFVVLILVFNLESCTYGQWPRNVRNAAELIEALDKSSADARLVAFIPPEELSKAVAGKQIAYLQLFKKLSATSEHLEALESALGIKRIDIVLSDPEKPDDDREHYIHTDAAAILSALSKIKGLSELKITAPTEFWRINDFSELATEKFSASVTLVDVPRDKIAEYNAIARRANEQGNRVEIIGKDRE